MCEFVSCKIYQGDNSIIVCALYRPPNSDLEYIQELCCTMENVCHSYPSATIWLGGDLNLPDIDWNLNSIKGHQYPHPINECYLDFQVDNCFVQYACFPMRKNNTLDIFASDHPSLITSCSPISGISDHDGVQFVWMLVLIIKDLKGKQPICGTKQIFLSY